MAVPKLVVQETLLYNADVEQRIRLTISLVYLISNTQSSAELTDTFSKGRMLALCGTGKRKTR